MEQESIVEKKIEWVPTEALASSTRLNEFMRKHGIGSFDELCRRSVNDLEWFWNAVIQDLDVQFYTPYSKVVDLSGGAPWAKWCVGGSMNIVHNCLDKRIGTEAEARTALRWEGEDGAERLFTYGELHVEVCRMAAVLRRLQVKKGDVVGIFMPMIPEIVVALLAAAKIGAVALPLFSGYGPEAVASRLASGEAQILITADGFFRRGQVVAMKEAADRSIELYGPLSSGGGVKDVIVVRRTGREVPWTQGRDHWWHELMSQADSAGPQAQTERTGAEDPLMLIYTSGTTGQPKGAVHTHCGFPIKAAQDLVHCFDLRPSDTIHWVTDMGWMMGPWLVLGAMVVGATVSLYEGAPDFPRADRLWDITERHRISILGISPTLVRALMQHGDAPIREHDLSSLRVLGSTGEPWNPDPWRWFFHTVGGGRLPIINYSGGTEISGGILGCTLTLPLKATSFSCAVPGIAADVVNDAGQSVRGCVGELVIRQPWIGMTRGFWKDDERYLESYWSRFPGIWTHGDWAMVDEDGQWFVLGRSDDTIKVAGKRLGPAEVESILVGHKAVLEAGCIGVPDPLKGQEIVCFCRLAPGHEPSNALREELRSLVAMALGKPLKPRDVKFVNDLPKTRNAKLMRRVIRAAYLGLPTGDVVALENPAAIEEIRQAR